MSPLSAAQGDTAAVDLESAIRREVRQSQIRGRRGGKAKQTEVAVEGEVELGEGSILDLEAGLAVGIGEAAGEGDASAAVVAAQGQTAAVDLEGAYPPRSKTVPGSWPWP